MNRHQKRVLVIGGILIALALLYPPFQIMGRGMGYSWLFSPPHDVAIINAGQLIVQWVAIVLIGGVAYLLVKDLPDSYRFDSIAAFASLLGFGQNKDTRAPRTTSLPAVEALLQKVESSPSMRQAIRTAFASMDAREPLPSFNVPTESLESATNPLYEAALADCRADYYLLRFAEFDKRDGELVRGWNWGAFFGGGVWALYRKMYGWFFAFWGLAFIARIFETKVSPTIGVLFVLVPWLAFTLYANSLYYRHVRSTIENAGGINHPAELLAHLRRKGGVHRWVLWIAISLPVLGILAGIFIPILNGE
jgi:hypothetical protein